MDTSPSYYISCSLWTGKTCSPFPGGAQAPSAQPSRECCSRLRQSHPPPSAVPCDPYQLLDPIWRFISVMNYVCTIHTLYMHMYYVYMCVGRISIIEDLDGSSGIWKPMIWCNNSGIKWLMLMNTVVVVLIQLIISITCTLMSGCVGCGLLTAMCLALSLSTARALFLTSTGCWASSSSRSWLMLSWKKNTTKPANSDIHIAGMQHCSQLQYSCIEDNSCTWLHTKIKSAFVYRGQDDAYCIVLPPSWLHCAFAWPATWNEVGAH